MKIKRFSAPTTRAALDLVKKEQGPDAVILSSQQTADGVEVVAATDYDEALLHQSNTRSTTTFGSTLDRTTSRIPAVDIRGGAEDVDPGGQDQEFDSLRKEFGSLRSLVQNQLSQMSWLNLSHDRPEHAALIKSLTGLGLTGDVVSAIAAELNAINDPANAWREALALFAKRIPITAEDSLLKEGRFAFVGTTGVGKTTTISKLATRIVLRGQSNQLGLISYQPQAMAAPDQLLRTGSILGVPVQQARSSADLRDTLSQLDSKKLVLIDTPGRSPRATDFDEPIAGLVDPSNRIRRILTLSGSTQEGFQRETLARYRHIEAESAVITKLDETTTLGALLSLLMRERLKIGYLTEGQELNKGLRSAHTYRAGIASRAVSLAKRFRDLDAEAPVEAQTTPPKLMARA